jgi:lambda repressor-like predicted transcriptional regulator
MVMSKNPPSAAFKSATPIILALKECDDELRAVAFELFEQLASGELDPGQEESTLALIAEILYPNADPNGHPGLDLSEAEAIARNETPEAGPILDAMDRQEASFAERLAEWMEKRGVTQAELAEKVGVGQPAISMMLNRSCRPQKKTVRKIASALGVTPEDLWPS